MLRCLSSQFEDMKVNFHMERLSVAIKDKRDKDEIIRLTVEDLTSTLTQRPGAQALKLVFKFLVDLIALVLGVLHHRKPGRVI